MAKVASTVSGASAVSVTPWDGFPTPAELIAAAKAKPGSLTFGSPGNGSQPHLKGELLKQFAGIDMVRVNYKATSEALSDLVSGQLHLSFHTVTSAVPYIKSGRLKALGVTGAERSMAYPELPTVAATVRAAAS